MKIVNEIKLSFPSKSCNEGFSRSAAASFAALADPSVSDISDIKTAVSEAVTNCIVHAYRNKTGIIEMTARILEGGRFYIKIKDSGCGISDVKAAMQPLFTTAPEEERAGLGFAVMESFTDRLKVTSHVGKGTCVIMQKKLCVRKMGNEQTDR